MTDQEVKPTIEITSRAITLLKQQKEFEEKIEKACKEERKEIIPKLIEIISLFKLSPSDLFPDVVKSSTTKVEKENKPKAPAKYIDPVSKTTWNGKGATPKWLKGKNRDDFLIEKNSDSSSNTSSQES